MSRCGILFHIDSKSRHRSPCGRDSHRRGDLGAWSRPTVPQPVRVAWLQPVVAHYRVPVIEQLAAQDGIELTVYAGQARVGIGVDDASSELTTTCVRLTNVWVPRGGARVLYSMGWSQVLRGGYRVLIIPEASHNFSNLLALILAPILGCRVIIMGHIAPWAGQGRRVGVVRSWMLRLAAGVIAYSETGRRFALASGVDARRVVAMGNTLDLNAIERAKNGVRAVQVAELRRDLGVRGPVLLFVGRPTAPKRLDVLLEALMTLRKRGREVSALVLGSSSELPAYRAFVRDNGIERVQFLGQIVDEEAIARYFRLADAVVIPGAVGLSANHSFAYGVPLVTSEGVDHRPEMALAAHDVNTHFVRRCDAQAFAQDLDALLFEDAERLNRLRRGAEATRVPSLNDMVSAIHGLISTVAEH